jgi:two-component system, OmpR family, phosphate regulon response regulator PhoB
MSSAKTDNLPKKKILIIDDEPDIVQYIKLLLEDNNYDVVSASDGKEGFELAKREKPDLVCLDIMMPRKTGVTLYQEIKTDEQLKKLPCIIISAYESAYTFKGTAFRRLVRNKAIPEPLKFFEKPLDIPVFLGFIDDFFKKAKTK